MRQAWTSSEIRWLTELAPEMTVAELCEKLERSKASIWGKLNQLGIIAKQQNKGWTVREVRVLQEMMHDFSYEDIAKELGRSSESVRGYAYRELNPPLRRKAWNPTREQIDRVAQLRADKVKLSLIARTMRCSLENIKWVVRREKIKRGIGYVHEQANRLSGD